MNKYEYKKIDMSPFNWFVLENFPFIEEDFDAITSYQLWCKLKEFFGKVADKTDEMGVQVENLTNAFIELQNYVDTYIENLDIQEEINNKLDEMVEDGTLEDILLNYSNINKIYNTTTSMISDTNITNGMKIKTLGYSEINDGGNSEFIITEEPLQNTFNFVLNNGLFANIIDLKSFKQMGKFNTSINYQEFSYFINKKIIDLEGNTFEPSVENLPIVLENIALKNGNIRFENATNQVPENRETTRFNLFKLKNNVTLENLNFENINTWHIILSDKKVKNINIKNCEFKNIVYSAIIFNPENENITVEKCLFDTIIYTSTSITQNRYFIASGSTFEDNTDVNFLIKNAKYINNKCLNNSLWEGIDCHGGENVVIKNNYIYNCYRGIMACADDRYINNYFHGNFEICDNEIYNEIGTTISDGIIFGGTNDNSITGYNFNIYNNKIINSNSNSNNNGAINFRSVKNVNIYNNIIEKSYNGIYCVGVRRNINIYNNKISSYHLSPIQIASFGSFNLNIFNNILNGLGTCINGVRISSASKGKIYNNTCYNISNVDINGLLNLDKFSGESQTTNHSFINYLDKIESMYKNIKYYSNSQGLCSTFDNFNSGTITVSGIIDTNYLEFSGGQSYEFIEGLHIILNDTDEYIIDYATNNKIYLTSNLLDNYNNVSIKPKKASLVLMD